jgi:hypothetical protein
MRFHWQRLPRLVLPIMIAFLLSMILMQELGLSRLTAVPIGLWIALQYQRNFLVNT